MYVHDKRDFRDREYKDRYGKVLHKGDLCLECEGESYEKQRSYRLYEVPGLDPFDGSGVHYLHDGNPVTFKFVNLSQSCKLDPTALGDDIMFTFYHGIDDFNSPIKFDDEHDNSLDIINASDYWILSYAKVADLDISKDIVPCPQCGKIPTLGVQYNKKHDNYCYAAVCECGATYEVSVLLGFGHPEMLREKCLIGWNIFAAKVKVPEKQTG